MTTPTERWQKGDPDPFGDAAAFHNSPAARADRRGRMISAQFDQGNRAHRIDWEERPGFMRRFDYPPEGVCALMECRTPAAMWVGRQQEQSGRTVTVAVGVCQEHYDQLQSGQLDAAQLPRLAP